jgi:predicted RNA-binding Zn ribbon-like protein
MPEVIANALALDFVNTVNKRPDPDRDLLATPDGFLMWVRAALAPLDPADGDIDDALLTAAVELREATHTVFCSVIAGDDPPVDAVDHLLAVHAEGITNSRLVLEGDRARVTWRSAPLRHVLWAVADSAVRLLINGPLGRLGVCPSCGWLFLDTSRNGTRRWCSMATCGSRSKSRRYYRRGTHT